MSLKLLGQLVDDDAALCIDRVHLENRDPGVLADPRQGEGLGGMAPALNKRGGWKRDNRNDVDGRDSSTSKNRGSQHLP